MGQKHSKRIDTVIGDPSSLPSTLMNNMINQLNLLDNQFKSNFDSESDKAMNVKGIKDPSTVSLNNQLRIEYLSEFNIEEIRETVTLSLKIANSAYEDKLDLTEKNINSFANLVANFYSQSKVSANSGNPTFSFLMNRVVPGVFVCVGCSSLSYKELQSFGKETVVGTSFIYKIMVSTDDIVTEERNNTIMTLQKEIEIVRSTVMKATGLYVNGLITADEQYDVAVRAYNAQIIIQNQIDALSSPQLNCELGSSSTRSQTSTIIYTTPLEKSLENQKIWK
ncbi:hypothetical protein PPL_03338 [Heterostelium album PN500]|uniref:Uncharacterized protein n=1 Tax=Heterostelium pallidum (strain ATCC 26659 / Pp 5 / PN500) TaxID=670386 RepID=D3B4L3_HETP5|nr:hypothetical protein PPL_03338 [Heterostelium album PN500]EFA84261.1 hypothetical protein PPL_03338 [Heterostelium album PN500]|eukprot:XP_020436377.1 hypothetical protein PPL_03338 [Heterostelium album PN500]